MESDGESTELVTVESAPLPANETRRADRAIVVPAIVAAGGDKAMGRFLEFFAGAQRLRCSVLLPAAPAR